MMRISLPILLVLIPLAAAQCPCVCRAGPNSRATIAAQCARPIFMNRGCIVDNCNLDNARMTPGWFCCDAPPSPSPSVSPPPPCPCTCRVGGQQTTAATRECNLRRFSRQCAVESCMLGSGMMRMGTHCCEPTGSAPTTNPDAMLPPCPCLCRTGNFARMASRNQCGRRDFLRRCRVSRCMRGGASGFQCCDP